MAYCQECGSEVAPEDSFCPYCGIALQSVLPVADSAPQTDASVQAANQPSEKTDYSKTEDFNLPSIPPPPKDSDASADFVGKSSLNEENISAEQPNFSDDSHQEATNDFREFQEENQEKIESRGNPPIYREQSEDSPSEAKDFEINSDFSAGKEIELLPELPKDNAGIYQEENQTDSASESLQKQPEISQNSDGKEDSTVSAENEESSEIKSLDEVEEKFPPLPDIAELSEKREVEQNQQIDDSDAAFKDQDFNETIPYTPTPFAVNSSETAFDAKDKAEESAPVEDNKSADKEQMPAPDFKFETPLNPLPLSDTPTPVFITIQPKEETVGNKIAERESTENSPLSAAQPNADAPVSTPINENKDGRSYTSPNIGGSDTDGKKAVKLKPLDEGTVLNGRYEIVRKIGGGGMGAVYLASDQNLGGVLRAVKEMVQSYIEEEQQDKAINDFKRESMILSTLDHPSIPTIYDYFFDQKESRFYLVMKYINGGDLAARLRSSPEGRLDEKTVTEWAVQIADVLDYLHNRPTTIIYRDLKPSNVMIDGNSGRVMLIDFGIARSVNKEEKGVTAVGTMGYAPPELFSGNVEPRSDIYSLGSTMFHLLTGADPQSNPLLIFDFNKNPRPRQINSRLSDQIEQILMKAVEYNSAQRFNSAAEMREVLKKHLDNLQAGSVTFGMNATAQKPSVGAIPAVVFCGFCGQKIATSDLFCPFCGAKQPTPMQAQAAPSAPSFVAPKLTAKLLVIGTNELDAPEFSLEKDNNLVGRRDPMSNIFPEVDLSKFDPQTKISRRHARIWKENNSYMLEDLGSSNGTVLMPAAKDSVRLLPRQPHLLTHGDKIRVGDTTLHFFIG